MISIRDQACYVPELPEDLHIISPKDIHKIEVYTGIFISNCHGDHDSYEEINLKDNYPGWQKPGHLKRLYIKYDPKNNLPTHKFNLPKQIYKEVKLLENIICVTIDAKQNLTPSQKEVLQWHFILVHIGFQHGKWLINTGRLKLQGNSNAVVNCERPKCSTCEF